MNPTTLSGLDHLQSMRALVRTEVAAQLAEFQRRMQKPLEERVEGGWCLEGLSWRRSDADDPGIAEFVMRGGNDSRLREGDYVRLSSVNGVDDFKQATIYREEDNALWLKLRQGTAWDELWLNSVGRECVLDADFVNLEPFYLRALDAVLQTSIGRECILPFLEGDKLEEAADFLSELETLSDSQMNDCQKDAVAECLAAPGCHLVQGPPGTGKTRALAELVTRCVRAGERVLITSFTHRAIHHALDAIVSFMGEPEKVVKIGAPIYSRGSAWRNYENFRDSPLARNDEDGWVVGATPFVLASRVKNVEFDRVIVDEASQMTMPLAVMAMLSGRKWFFFGDGEQLGPVMTSMAPREAREWSCFRMLGRLAQTTMLDTGYRMNDALTVWPSETFYAGELKAAPAVALKELSLACKATEPALVAVLDPANPLIWVAFDHGDGHVMQDEEALAAARIVQALVNGGVRAEDIAIVVPWRKQARRIRHHLRGRLPEDAVRLCTVDTVERMQGQEREVVIVSMASSEAMFLARHAEFIFQPNRLNVAVTRARTKTIVLASRVLENFSPDGNETAEDAAVFRSLLKSATLVDHAF